MRRLAFILFTVSALCAVLHAQNRQDFENKLRAKAYQDWSAWNNPFKGDFDSFYAEVYNETNGFDPNNENTAKVAMGADFKRFQKSYRMACLLESVNVHSILSHRVGLFTGHSVKEAVRDKETVKSDESFQSLVSFIARDMTTGQPEYVQKPGMFGVAVMVSPYEETAKSVSERIQTIVNAYGDTPRGIDELHTQLDSWGYDLQLMRQWSLF